ncbi:hypothetical protein SAY87_007127 [Trapa incisa]|uniref:F-box/LRR-repeat protein 15-like leucin rich repeat domain-containing protein n=1 Tax=Trapa incisa TaxID=236973 RepID=A0AAN7K3L7_9MYRT|nr:hypothetical protein SAY87_007127 [Trapa incisa]
MPTLVNYNGGDGEFLSGGFFAHLCSMDAYYPPPKRARVLCSPHDAEVKDDHGPHRRPSIDVLPDECLFEIFRRVYGGRDRMSSASVCKRWLFLLGSMRRSEILNTEDEMEISLASGDEDGHPLTRCLEEKDTTDVRLAALAIGASTGRGLGKVSIRGSNSTVHGVSGIGLSYIARSNPSLKTLSLWSISSIGDESLSEIARECRSLEKLDLCLCPSISSKGLTAIARNCPSLTALTVESCARIGNESLEAVGKHCPRLQSIAIKDCPLVGDRGVVSLVSSASPVLGKIKLQGLSITDFSLAVIGHYGLAVTALVLNGLKDVTEKGFWVMGNAQGLKRLSSLTVISCGGLTDVSLGALGRCCTNLRQVCLRRCGFISDAGLLGFGKAAGALESFCLEGSSRISLAGVVGLLSNCGSRLKALAFSKCMGVKDLHGEAAISTISPCKSLRSFSIQNCPGFGDASIALVARLCPGLHHIDFTGLWRITDSGLLPLFERCKEGLKTVNLTNCVTVTDEAIFALTRLHGVTLEMLSLDGCRKVSDSSLEAIGDNCLFINDLHLSRCSITDSGISILSSAEQICLQVLSLSGCSRLSHRSLPSLKRLGESLIGLNLQGCCSISITSVEFLRRSLRRCDIVF